MSTTAIVMNGLLEAEYFDLESHAVRDTFRIFVAKPPFVPPGEYPAIFAADGNSTFAMTLSIQRMLAWGAEVPPAFVIGIGYPTEGGYLPAISKRNRDLPATDSGDYAQRVLGSTYMANGSAYLQFIRDELRPALESRYTIQADDSTFVGASLGGLFGAWTLLTQPTTFQRYVLVSPALWWQDEAVWRWEQALAQERTELTAKVFISAGCLEYPEEMRRAALHIAVNNPLLKPQVDAVISWHDQHGWPRTTALAEELAAKLCSRNYSGLAIHCHNFPDEAHMTVSPAAISRGLRYVFGH